jgi:hypothetical protein
MPHAVQHNTYLIVFFFIPFILTTNVTRIDNVTVGLVYVGISVFDVWEQCLVFFCAAIR